MIMLTRALGLQRRRHRFEGAVLIFNFEAEHFRHRSHQVDVESIQFSAFVILHFHRRIAGIDRDLDGLAGYNVVRKLLCLGDAGRNHQAQCRSQTQ